MEHVTRLFAALTYVIFELLYLAGTVLLGVTLGLLLIPKVILSLILKEDRVSDIDKVYNAWLRLEP